MVSGLEANNSLSSYEKVRDNLGVVHYICNGTKRSIFFPINDDELLSMGQEINAYVGETKYNITPPPGVSMKLTPLNLNVDSITFKEKTYLDNEEVVFPENEDIQF